MKRLLKWLRQLVNTQQIETVTVPRPVAIRDRLKELSRERDALERELTDIRRACAHEAGDEGGGYVYCKHCLAAIRFSK